MLRHSAATGVTTGKLGSKQTSDSIPYKTMLGDCRSTEIQPCTCPIPDQYLLKCDALSYEGVVKSVQTSPRRNKEVRPVRGFSPSILLYETVRAKFVKFRTYFPVATRCSSLASLYGWLPQGYVLHRCCITWPKKNQKPRQQVRVISPLPRNSAQP